VFLSLLTAYLVSVIRRAPDAVRRRRAKFVIAWVLGVTSIVGITQIDAWPFTNWALVHMVRAETMNGWIVEATDEHGRTVEVDPRVFQPMPAEELGAPLGRFELLPP